MPNSGTAPQKTAAQQSAFTSAKFRFSSPAIVIVLLLACTILLRLPSALTARELNSDESVMLSVAMHFLVPGYASKALDAGNLGPLDSMLPAAFLLLGFKPSYIFIHILATVLICLQVLVAYLTLRRITSDKAAVFGTLLMVLFYGLASHPDLLHYSTELLPSLLCMLGFYAFVVLLDSPEARGARRPVLFFLGGLVLGAAPWGKIQSLPIVGALGLLTIAAILNPYRHASGRYSRSMELVSLGTGAALPTCVLLAIWAQAWSLKEFWYSFIAGPLAYAGQLSFAGTLRNAVLIFILAPLSQLLLIGVLVAIYASFRADSVSLSPRQRWIWAGLLVYLSAALFAIFRVRYPFPHHEVFVVPPIIYVIAKLASGALGATQGRQPSTKWVKVPLALAICAAALIYGSYAVHYYKMVRVLHPASAKHNTAAPESHSSIEQMAVTIRMMQRTNPIRSLAIWGWAPGVYVLTGIPPALRDVDTYFQTLPGALHGYYRSRLLTDLQSSQPDLFVDAAVPSAVPKWTDWPGEIGYEADPELKKYIDENYVLADQLTLVNGEKPVRFFLRKTESSPASPNVTP